ncbi:MAG TPA: hypothetical protein VFV05_18560, partial [Methylomirabilota bacterium]|nr:hypothetical protein [Methylomirabilota bacterium]
GLVGLPALVLAFRGRPPMALAAGRLAALAVGLAGPLAFCAAFYVAKGGLPHLLDAQFVYAVEYVRAAQARVTLGCAFERMSRTVFLPLHVMAALTAGGLVVAGLRHRRPPLLTTLAVAWLAVGLLVLGVSALFLEYHHLPLIAPLAVASAPVLDALVRAARSRRAGAWLVLGLIAISLFWPAQKFVEKARVSREIISGRLVHPWNQLGLELGRHTRRDETLFVWGNAPIVYVSADRRAASRFMNVVPVTMPLPEAGNAARRQLLLEELAANRPRYIVYQKVRLNPVWISLGCLMPTDVAGTWERFAALRHLVDADYEQVEDTERWTVFRRKSGGGS